MEELEVELEEKEHVAERFSQIFDQRPDIIKANKYFRIISM